MLSTYVHDPQFQGQTKNRLNNPEVAGAGRGARAPGARELPQRATRTGRRPSSRGRSSRRAPARRRARRSEVTRKTAVSHRLNLPGKLADCSSTDPGRERAVHRRGRLGRRLREAGPRSQDAGDPAAARQGAERRAGEQPEAAREQGAAGHRVARSAAAWARRSTSAKLRYGKIFLLMDADADGHHIATLLLTFFFRHMRPLIDNGHVYLAQPPLYRIDIGKQTYWALDDVHKERSAQGAREEQREAEHHAVQGPRRDEPRHAEDDDARPEDAPAAARHREGRRAAADRPGRSPS